MSDQVQAKPAVNGETKRDKIILAIPAWPGSINTLVADSIFTAVRYADAKLPNVFIQPRFMQRGMIDRMRQNLHEFALENEYSHILWWDDDILAPIDTIVRLYNHQKSVVSGMAFVRTEPFGMFAYKCVDGNFKNMKSFHHLPIKFKGQGLVEVDATGTGCMLMRTNVVEPLERPWWRWPLTGSEDIALCARLRQLGMQIYVDTDIELGHLSFDPTIINSNHHKLWCEKAEDFVLKNPNIRNHEDYIQLKEMIDGSK